MTRLSEKQLRTAVTNGASIIDFDRPVMSQGVTKCIFMPAFGKARPRVTKNGTFMPRDYEKKKKYLRWQFGEVPPGLVHLSVTAVRRMPKDWSKAQKERRRGTYAKPKPDADNILGAIMDALFPDDTDDDDRVISVFCEKVWGDKHELVIEVAPAGQED